MNQEEAEALKKNVQAAINVLQELALDLAGKSAYEASGKVSMGVQVIRLLYGKAAPPAAEPA